MGGTVGERLGTKKVAEGAQQREQNYYHQKIAAPADEAGMHMGQQTGLAMDGFNHAMGQVADTFSRSDFNLAKSRDSGGDQGAQTAEANYTGQGSTQRSGSGKRGSGKLTSKDTKKKQSKKALTITK